MALPYDEAPTPFVGGCKCPDCGVPCDAYEQDWKGDYYKCPECGCIARVERDREDLTVGDLDLDPYSSEFRVPSHVGPYRRKWEDNE